VIDGVAVAPADLAFALAGAGADVGKTDIAGGAERALPAAARLQDLFERRRPDRAGDAPAGHARTQRSRPVEAYLHDDHQLGREAAEPGIAAVVCRARLATDGRGRRAGELRADRVA